MNHALRLETLKERYGASVLGPAAFSELAHLLCLRQTPRSEGLVLLPYFFVAGGRRFSKHFVDFVVESPNQATKGFAILKRRRALLEKTGGPKVLFEIPTAVAARQDLSGRAQPSCVGSLVLFSGLYRVVKTNCVHGHPQGGSPDRCHHTIAAREVLFLKGTPVRHMFFTDDRENQPSGRS